MDNTEQIKNFNVLQLETKRLLVYYLEKDFFPGFKNQFQIKVKNQKFLWFSKGLGCKKMQPIIDFFIEKNKSFFTDFLILLQNKNANNIIDQILKNIRNFKNENTDFVFLIKMSFLEESLMFFNDLKKNNLDLSLFLFPSWAWMIQECFNAVLPLVLAKQSVFWQKEIDLLNTKTQILHHAVLDNDLLFVNQTSCLSFCKTPFLLEKIKPEELLSQKLHFSFLNRILTSIWDFEATFFPEKNIIPLKNQKEWLFLLQKKPEIQRLKNF